MTGAPDFAKNRHRAKAASAGSEEPEARPAALPASARRAHPAARSSRRHSIRSPMSIWNRLSSLGRGATARRQRGSPWATASGWGRGRDRDQDWPFVAPPIPRGVRACRGGDSAGAVPTPIRAAAHGEPRARALLCSMSCGLLATSCHAARTGTRQPRPRPRARARARRKPAIGRARARFAASPTISGGICGDRVASGT